MFEQIQDTITYLEQHFQNQSLSEDVVFHSAELNTLELDYTDESLQRLESLLHRLQTQNISIEMLSQDQKGQHFVLFCANYLSVCIARRVHKKRHWLSDSSSIAQYLALTPTDDALVYQAIALIEKHAIPALQPIYQHLTEKSSLSLLAFVEQHCEILSQLDSTETSVIYQHYIHALKFKQYLPNGNAYRRLIQLIQFDGSLRSLDEIDSLLLTIKNFEGLQHDNQTAFIGNAQKFNVVIALGFYLGYVISVHGRVSLSWMNLEEAQHLNLAQSPSLPQAYFAANHKFTIQPMQHILNILFNDHAEKTSREFVQSWVSTLQGGVYILPSQLRVEQHEQLLPSIEQAFKHAGYFAAYLTQQLKIQQAFTACVYLVKENNEFEILNEINANDERLNTTTFWISAEPSHIDLPDTRLNSIKLKLHLQQPISFVIDLQIPYQLEQDHFTVYSAIRDQHNDLTLHEMKAAIAKFYQEAFRFADPDSMQSFWAKHFKELSWPQANTSSASADQMFELKQRLQQQFILKQDIQPDENTQSIAPQIATSQPKFNPIELDLAKTIATVETNPTSTPPITETIHVTPKLNIPQDLNPFSKINIQREIEHLPTNYLSYLQVLPPTWILQDPLHNQIKAISTLYHTGKVVWGSLIPSLTNTQIDENTVVHFVYDPTGQSSRETLEHAAQCVDNIQNSADLPNDQQHYLQALQQADIRFQNFAYPYSLNPSKLLIGSSWVWSSHLADGQLSLASCPIIITDNSLYAGAVMPLPSWFWPKSLRQEWLTVSQEHNGEDQDINPIIFKNLELFQRIRPDLDPLSLQPSLSSLVDQTGNDLNLEIDSLLLENTQPRDISISPLTQKVLIALGIVVFIGIMLL